VGELTGSGPRRTCANLGLTELACDTVLDVRCATFKGGSAVTLVSRVAGPLARGRFSVLFPSIGALQLTDNARLENEFLNLRIIIRHPSRVADRFGRGATVSPCPPPSPPAGTAFVAAESPDGRAQGEKLT